MAMLPRLRTLVEQKNNKPRTRGQSFIKVLARKAVRKKTVAFCRWMRRRGVPRSTAATRLGLSPFTVGRWCRQCITGRLKAAVLGRPPRPTDPLIKEQIEHHLESLGPRIGVPALRGIFPEVPRMLIRQFLTDYRRQWYDNNMIETEALEWAGPGVIWAGDFTDPPVPIDGRYNHILAVRDLASHMYLMALPLVNATAEIATAAIELLFTSYGPPLVFKSDNGSQFIADIFREFLRQEKVSLLLSPALTPRYNGSVEASNGWLKTNIFHQAISHGRGSNWTTDDVESARCNLNAAMRPWGDTGPTPIGKWEARSRISQEQRLLFGQTVDKIQRQVLLERGMENKVLDRNQQAAVARFAIRRALQELGYLLVQRKRISPPFNSPLRAKFR